MFFCVLDLWELEVDDKVVNWEREERVRVRRASCDLIMLGWKCWQDIFGDIQLGIGIWGDGKVRVGVVFLLSGMFLRQEQLSFLGRYFLRRELELKL